MGNIAKENAAGNRILSLLDAGSFVEIGGAVTARATDFNLQEKDTPADGVITGYGGIEHVPKTAVICGITPDARDCFIYSVPNASRASVASWSLSPALSISPMTGAPIFIAKPFTRKIVKSLTGNAEKMLRYVEKRGII